MQFADPVKNCKWAKYPLGDVTQWFGENPELYQKYGSTKAHNGVDIVRPHGEHIFAPADGLVASTKEDPGGYGKAVRLLTRKSMKYGEWYDWAFGHLSYIHVKPGERVKKGEYIGDMGNTGFVVSNATGNGYWDANPYAGTHLHLGVRVVREDPKGWSYGNGMPKVKVVDYRNGYKGHFDPLEMFRPIALLSSKIIRIASAVQDKVLFQFGQILRKIDM